MPALTIADADSVIERKIARTAETLSLVASSARRRTVDTSVAEQIGAWKAAVASERRASSAGSAARDVKSTAFAGVSGSAKEHSCVITDAEARGGHSKRLTEDQIVGAAGADSGTGAESAR